MSQIESLDGSEDLGGAERETLSLRIIEALLFASREPLGLEVLSHHLPDETDTLALLERLQALYSGRGVELVRVGEAWAFRTAPDLAERLAVERQVQRKLSRAAVETLAIVAYHQPITRAEIEEIRGVGLNKGTLDVLLEAGWIRPRGRRRTPGRPLTWGTSQSFLDHFGLASLNDLPGVEELRAAGLLDSRPALTALNSRGDLGALARPPGQGEADGSDLDEAAEPEEGENSLEADFGEALMPRVVSDEEDEKDSGGAAEEESR